MNPKKSNIGILLIVVFLLLLSTTLRAQAGSALQHKGKITFTSDRDGNSEIYLMNADGTGQTRLTNSPAREDYPTWSPDGRRIAFLKQSKGIFSINLMNADGTNQSEVTRFVPNNIQSYPYERFGMSWSPDGTRIAFQDSNDIFTINIDGTNRINLTNGQFINYEPAWSPDGSRIAFARSIYFHGFYPNVYVMNADGSNVTRITTSPDYGESRSPDWAPDGQKLTLGSSADLMDGPSLALMNPDGTSLQFLLYYYPLNINRPKWSPDGTKIVLYRSGSDNISQIWTVNRDGSGLTQLTTTSPNNFDPDWQPLAVNVSTIEELYSAVNNPQNTGSQINIAPGTYTLSVNDVANMPRPNGGRLELQDNMSLQGVIGDRGSVVIDAANLPSSSYNQTIANSGAVRMGRGNNSIEWITIRNAGNGNGAGIIVYLSAPGTTHIRVAHVDSTNNFRGIDIRNVGATSTAYIIDADILDNDFANSPVQGLRIVNFDGANGGVITARLSDNRSHDNREGLLVANRNSSSSSISVTLLRDQFYTNGAGAIILGGYSGSSAANGNSVTFNAQNASFADNNGFSNFDLGGLIVVGGENTAFENGTSNNTVQVNLSGCPTFRNQSPDLGAWGARSNPASIGSPGTNNNVTISRFNPGPYRVKQIIHDSVPYLPGLMNLVTIKK